jgi:hypothetical protein
MTNDEVSPPTTAQDSGTLSPERRKPTQCDRCGKPIYWIRFEGKSVPLDFSAPVYMRMWDPDGKKHYWHLVGDAQALVSHHASCGRMGHLVEAVDRLLPNREWLLSRKEPYVELPTADVRAVSNEREEQST